MATNNQNGINVYEMDYKRDELGFKRFVQRVQDANLKGFAFKLLWSSESS